METPDALTPLFEPVTLGPVEIKNRIVLSPMAVEDGSPEGYPTEQTMAFNVARAKGGVGLIVLGGCVSTERAWKESPYGGGYRLDIEEAVPASSPTGRRGPCLRDEDLRGTDDLLRPAGRRTRGRHATHRSLPDTAGDPRGVVPGDHDRAGRAGHADAPRGHHPGDRRARGWHREVRADSSSRPGSTAWRSART